MRAAKAGMGLVNRNLRRSLLLFCTAVYAAGMITIIEVARGSPLRVITDVKYALAAYCCVVVSCIGSMLLFSRRVANSSETTS
jgi:hypothetical protein